MKKKKKINHKKINEEKLFYNWFCRIHCKIQKICRFCGLEWIVWLVVYENINNNGIRNKLDKVKQCLCWAKVFYKKKVILKNSLNIVSLKNYFSIKNG